MKSGRSFGLELYPTWDAFGNQIKDECLYVNVLQLELMHASPIKSIFIHLHGFQLIALLPSLIEIASLLEFRPASNFYKKAFASSAKLGSPKFWYIGINVFNKGKSIIPPPFYPEAVVEISFNKVVGYLFSDSMSLMTQEEPPRLVPSGEILIAQNLYLRLLQRFFLSSAAASNW